MGNSSVQITHTACITQVATVQASACVGTGHLVVPARGSTASNSAPHLATPVLLDDAVREAPASLPLPGERVGAPTPRCIPLFASVVRCSARAPGAVCVNIAVSGFFRVCPVGHTSIPTASAFFRRVFVDEQS